MYIILSSQSPWPKQGRVKFWTSNHLNSNHCHHVGAFFPDFFLRRKPWRRNAGPDRRGPFPLGHSQRNRLLMLQGQSRRRCPGRGHRPSPRSLATHHLATGHLLHQENRRPMPDLHQGHQAAHHGQQLKDQQVQRL